MTVSGVTGGIEPELSVDVTELAQSAWGWFLERLPGRRYRKLLTRGLARDELRSRRGFQYRLWCHLALRFGALNA